MTASIIVLAASFLVILAGSELFTNGIEWAGEKLQVAEAAVGSLLAAVGTALPETMIPAVAFLTSRGTGARKAVGIGAIIGAPLMLTTVALFVMGAAGLIYRSRRGESTLRVSPESARLDLSFFLPVLLIVLLAGIAQPGWIGRYVLAGLMLAVYALYAVLMLRMERDVEAEVEHGLYLSRIFDRGPHERPRGATIAVQVFLGVAAILFGARTFVEQVVHISRHFGLNPGVVSLLLSPLATELPEKYNSVVWIRQRKDHLALANITGAMVFQSCIPTSLGLLFTPWHLTGPELLAGGIAIVSAALLFVRLRGGLLNVPTLMMGGVAYAVFLIGLWILGTI